ncbi:preprotein translocase subunit SecG [Marinomonas sp. M1K-6]|uniref:Protein-export membrane protein SecG n=1 Tax=Marinomonas profundi TaxID=2726122 RepID=A0A847R1P0_9GAMM|nr:preprotein translocase subunit SecG [Marinomonas profundi]NLQ17632.1 preprotein translocase subunit SecG [Marinomonas profundi]UDV02151.1 preprotein translocase subunit SecG [Marinomonas profundi]
METLILVLHVLAAIIIIALVLLQQGKGADAGASFGGGASQTVFGSQGGGSFFGKMTALFALVFFLTSFGLAYYASEQAKSVSGSLDFVPSAPQVEETIGLPELGGSTKSSSSDLPVTE